MLSVVHKIRCDLISKVLEEMLHVNGKYIVDLALSPQKSRAYDLIV